MGGGCVSVFKGLPGWFGALIFPYPNEQFLVLEGGRGVKRLPVWFVHFLAQLDNVKKKTSNTTPFTNLRIVYLMHILIAGRMYCILLSNVMVSIRNEKNRSRKNAHSNRLTVRGVKRYKSCIWAMPL